MLIFVAVALLLVLPSPWNLVGFLVVLPLWVAELFGWNRTVKQVRLDGEIWEARCDAGASPGASVRIIARDGLTLVVEPAAS